MHVRTDVAVMGMDCVIRQMHVALLQIRAGPVTREEAGPLHYMGADSAVYGFD
jgi:hypothetical protein